MSEILNPIRPHAAEILEIKQETDLEWTFKVKEEAKVLPGQFLQLSIPKVGEAPISVSQMGDGWLDFTLRSVGKVTSGLFAKKPGDKIFLRGPYGHGWPMDQLKGKHLVVVTGGTGLSPVRSVLNMALEDPDLFPSVNILTGFKNHDSILFKEDLVSWYKAKHMHTIYCLDTETYDEWHQGFVTNYIKNIPFAQFGDNYAVLLVGPPPMMHFAGLELLKNGVQEDHIWMSFERKMQCAIGKCGNCRINETYVCTDGPVFPYPKAKNLVD